MLNPEIQKSTNWIVAVITDLKRCVSHEIFTQIVLLRHFSIIHLRDYVLVVFELMRYSSLLMEPFCQRKQKIYILVYVCKEFSKAALTSPVC